VGGSATTIKTLANIYYKGIQALCLELALSAWKVGIDPQLLAPLVVKPVESLPKEEEMAFWIIRGILQAERKAAELESIIKACETMGCQADHAGGNAQTSEDRFRLRAQELSGG